MKPATILRLSPLYLDLYTEHLSPLNHEIERISIASSTWVRNLKGDEEDVLSQAVRMLTKNNNTLIVGYNSSIFDLPFLSMRMVALDMPSSLSARLRRAYHVDMSDIVHQYLQPFGRFTNWREIAPVLKMPSNASKLDVTRELYERTADLCRQDLQKKYPQLRSRSIVFDKE